MARGATFLKLFTMLRGEIHRSADPAVGIEDLPVLKTKLNRVYETLYDGYDWPHLLRWLPKQNFAAGQRYYDVPSGQYEELREVIAWWNNTPHPLARGIGWEQYSAYDSEADERSDPALRYEIRFTGTKEQIEIWPIPGSASPFQVVIKRQFAPLVNDADVCLIDDQSVVLAAAAELHPDGNERVRLQAAALMRLDAQKANTKNDTEGVRMGMGSPSSIVPHQVIVRVK